MKFKIGDRIKSTKSILPGELGTIKNSLGPVSWAVLFDNGILRGKKECNMVLAHQHENFQTVKEYLGIKDTLIDEKLTERKEE